MTSSDKPFEAETVDTLGQYGSALDVLCAAATYCIGQLYIQGSERALEQANELDDALRDVSDLRGLLTSVTLAVFKRDNPSGATS